MFPTSSLFSTDASTRDVRREVSKKTEEKVVGNLEAHQDYAESTKQLHKLINGYIPISRRLPFSL